MRVDLAQGSVQWRALVYRGAENSGSGTTLLVSWIDSRYQTADKVSHCH
jgi:hypothetical protein